MSSNIYTTGLRNDGSYKVSGQPFVVRKTINVGEEVKVEFPYVAKNVTVRIPNPPNTALDDTPAHGRSRLRTSDDTGVNNAAPGVYNLGGSNDFTVSFWFDYRDAGNRAMVYDLVSSGSRNGNQFKRLSADEFGWNTFAALKIGSISQAGGFHHMVLTQHTGNVHLYIDNNHVAVNGVSMRVFDDMAFKPNVNVGQAASASFDEITVWNDGMNYTEYLELHNSGEWYNPNYHSKKTNLLSWHTMGDAVGDHVQGSAPGEVMIRDLAGTDEPLHLFSTSHGGLSGQFTSGPFTSQTTGKIRVHTLSTGSASGANIVANNHYKELQGYGESYTFPMKGKEIYISGLGAQTTVEIIAELTNIPTGSMYALTGSGIDE